MSIVYGVKLMADLCLYLAELGIVSLLADSSPFLLILALLLSLGAGAGFTLARRDERWRLIPLIPALLALALGRRVYESVLGMPMMVYAIFYVTKNHTATDYYYAFQRFKIGLIVLASTLVLALLLDSQGVQGAVPAIFLHLTLMTALLRMLRHDDRVIGQRRFQAINLTGIAGVCLAGWILSTDAALSAIKAVLGFLYEQVILRVVNVILWIVGMILQGLFYLLSLLPIQGIWEDLNLDGQLGLGQDGGLLEGLTAEDAASNPVLEAALKTVGILLGIAVAFLILRALARQTGRMHTAEQREERETLDETEPGAGRRPGLLQRRRDPMLSVRYTYQRFLRQANGRGVPLNGRQNSRQVRDLSREAFDETALNDLRQVYIRVRYGEKTSPDDARQAKDAYGRLKKGKSA